MAAMIPVITIDGPSGSGKGTISHWLAEQLGWHMLDSGALYRIVAYVAGQQQLTPTTVQVLAQLARQLQVEFRSNAQLETRVWLNGQDVSLQLRTEECARLASQIAVVPEVRRALLDKQHAFRKLPGLVADGRDMGTVVFKDAVLKIFLTASAEERAKRRYKQLNEKGIGASLAGLLQDIRARDERDISRTDSPLRSADDAYILDTTAMSIQDVCVEILKMASAKGLK